MSKYESYINEVKDVMNFLGRGMQDGDVRGSNLGKIFSYLV